MAVYKKTYRPYGGTLRPSWSRFLVVARYAYEDLRRSRFLSFFYIASFLYPLGCAVVVYVRYNLGVLETFGLAPSEVLQIDAPFYLALLGFQSMLAFFLNAFIGPGLVAPDLANNALPLYLSRPFSRAEYVLGKMSVLVILFSLMTWIPGLALFALQGYLAGLNWTTSHLRIPAALFLGSWIWILILSLLSLAISAWVKWKPVAGALLFGIFFVVSGFSAAINAVLKTKWGHLMNMSHLIGSVWVSLFEEPLKRGAGAVFFRVALGEEIPVWCCWISLISLCLFCVYLLDRKIRGVEVVQ